LYEELFVETSSLSLKRMLLYMASMRQRKENFEFWFPSTFWMLRCMRLTKFLVEDEYL